MTNYINNVNTYLSQMKIKQTYISMKSGIDTKKLSHILTGVRDVSGMDMDKIADALGKKVDFFLKDSLCVPQIKDFTAEKVDFYAGDPTRKQEEMVEKLVELMQNIDVVLSAKGRFLNMAEE